MIYLLACILCSTALNFVFKLFPKYHIVNFPAIVTNYFVCALIGITYFIVINKQFLESVSASWFAFAVVLGIAFIVGFTIVAKTVQLFGVGITTMAQKMSMVITVIIAISFYEEGITLPRLAGIAVAIIAIILISKPERISTSLSWKLWILPLLTFTINGVIETGLYIVEKSGRIGQEELLFTTTLFFFAGSWGLIKMVADLNKKRYSYQIKELIGGLVLGIPNFGSIAFLLLALNSGLDGAMVFPFNNVIILLLSVLLGYFIFREKISRNKWIGFLFAVFSILFLSLK